MKSWRAANPEKCCAYTANRKARKIKATPTWADSEQEIIQKMYDGAKLLTKTTGIKHHVDHIVSLNSKLVQDFYCLSNLQILEAKENISKGNRTWPDMP